MMPQEKWRVNVIFVEEKTKCCSGVAEGYGAVYPRGTACRSRGVRFGARLVAMLLMAVRNVGNEAWNVIV